MLQALCRETKALGKRSVVRDKGREKKETRAERVGAQGESAFITDANFEEGATDSRVDLKTKVLLITLHGRIRPF